MTPASERIRRASVGPAAGLLLGVAIGSAVGGLAAVSELFGDQRSGFGLPLSLLANGAILGAVIGIVTGTVIALLGALHQRTRTSILVVLVGLVAALLIGVLAAGGYWPVLLVVAALPCLVAGGLFRRAIRWVERRLGLPVIDTEEPALARRGIGRGSAQPDPSPMP